MSKSKCQDTDTEVYNNQLQAICLLSGVRMPDSDLFAYNEEQELVLDLRSLEQEIEQMQIPDKIFCEKCLEPLLFIDTDPISTGNERFYCLKCNGAYIIEE